MITSQLLICTFLWPHIVSCLMWTIIKPFRHENITHLTNQRLYNPIKKELLIYVQIRGENKKCTCVVSVDPLVIFLLLIVFLYFLTTFAHLRQLLWFLLKGNYNESAVKGESVVCHIDTCTVFPLWRNNAFLMKVPDVERTECLLWRQKKK